MHTSKELKFENCPNMFNVYAGYPKPSKKFISIQSHSAEIFSGTRNRDHSV